MINPKKIKVFFILPTLGLGGIERHLLRQISFFNKNKYNFYIVTLFSYHARKNLDNKMPKDILVKNFNFKGYFDLRNLFKFIYFLKKEKPDILVTSMFAPNMLGRALKPFFSYKLISREHNTYTDRAWWQKFLDRMSIFLVDRIIAVSEGVADFHAKQINLSRNRYIVIPNSVDKNLLNDELKKTKIDIYKEYSLQKDQKILLNVARLKPQKNHKLLLEAFEEFVKIHPEYVLCILGDGNEKPYLLDQINQLNLNKKVFLLGFVDHVTSFYEKAELFILTSNIEGFPNVVLEALSFGVPVISTEVSGVPEIIKQWKNGVIVRRDKESIVKALCAYENLPINNKNDLKVNARNSIENFSLKRNVNSYEKVFEEILT